MTATDTAAGTQTDKESAGEMAAGVARGGLWAVSGQAVVLAATFIATPFTIRLLGPTSYGLWSLLWSALLYFTLAEMGMATASTRFAAERYAQKDPEGETAVVWTAIAVTAAFTSAAALAASLAAPFIVDQILNVPDALQPDATLAFRLVSVAAVAYALTEVVNTPQQVRLRWGSLTLATSGPRALQVAIAPILLAALDGGIVLMSCVVAATAALAAFLNFAVATHFQPRLRRPRLSTRYLRPMLKYGGWLAVAGLSAIPLRTAERFLLAHFHSPKEVAFYAVAASLGALLAVVPAALSQPMLSSLTRLSSEGRDDDHRWLYHLALRGVLLVTTPVALILAFIAHPFLELWAGPAYGDHSVTPFYVILVGLWFNTLAYAPFYQLLSAGRTSTIAVIHLAELIPYIALAALLTSRFGVVGAAVAWTVRVIVDSVAFFAIARIRDRLPWVPTPKRAFEWLLGTTLLAVGLWLLSSVTGTLAARAGWSVVAIGLYGAMQWNLVLTTGEKQGLLRLIGTVLPSRFNLSPREGD